MESYVNKRIAILVLIAIVIVLVIFLFTAPKRNGRQYEYSEQKQAVATVQDGSYYGPPFEKNLYQLELENQNHLFAKSESVDLGLYMGKVITVKYREVVGQIMGEQQLVIVDEAY